MPANRFDRPGRPGRAVVAPTRSRLGLVTLAAATFVYVTAETLPVGLLPQLSVGLHVRPGTVGLLVTVYAAVAGLTAIPLTASVGHRSRRTVMVACVAVLTLSQFVVALAPDYAVVLAARVMCALAHGVFWSMLAPVAARLAPSGQAGRATALVFVGNSVALVGGIPLGTALGHAVGWRAAMAALGLAAALTTVALRRVLPELPAAGPATGSATDPIPDGRAAPEVPATAPEPVPGGVRARLAGVPAALRSGPLLAVCAVTVIVVTGHFAAYTYITALVRRDAGLSGLGLSAVLFGYGAAGIGGILLAGRFTDRRPRLANAACVGGVVVALAALATIAHGSTVGTVASVAAWGAGFTAMPVCLQAAVLRVAPRSTDTASALYVVAFQIGIGGGALAGSLLVNAGLLAILPTFGLLLALAGLLVLLTARRAFPPASSARPPASSARPPCELSRDGG
ncbi:MAG TPA: MFS transporter [Streptosporangiaceae bacterium]|nr:MFS transporter [Streptosporangiaceae bacterium]